MSRRKNDGYATQFRFLDPSHRFRSHGIPCRTGQVLQPSDQLGKVRQPAAAATRACLGRCPHARCRSHRDHRRRGSAGRSHPPRRLRDRRLVDADRAQPRHDRAVLRCRGARSRHGVQRVCPRAYLRSACRGCEWCKGTGSVIAGERRLSSSLPGVSSSPSPNRSLQGRRTFMSSRKISRRKFVKLTGGAAAAAGFTSAFLFPARALAQQKTLKIMQWSHFVPGYDKWFDGTFTKEWGAKHNTNVIVDHIAIGEINARAAAEVAAGKGHDLFMFLAPPAAYEKQTIDHREIYEAVEKKHGKKIELAEKSTFNPKTKRYFAFSDS